jgi:hypothetical protein
MNGQDQPGHGWTVVLRRQPARIVEGRPEGGYTDRYELICCDCGDDPDRDYREVSAELQHIRGPYLFAAGIAAYERHVERRHRRQAITSQAARRGRTARSSAPTAHSR